MATTGLTTEGKYFLFKYGWTTKIAQAKLYTDSDVLVDTQTVSFSYTSGYITIDDDIVFDVAASTQDVSYVVIGFTQTTPSTLWVPFYTKTFATMYDFTSAGTLTVDSWSISLSATYITTDGKEELFTNGFEDISSAKLYTSGSTTLLDTQSISFSSNVSTGVLELDSTVVFDVSSGTAYSIQLTVGAGSTLYQRILSSSYEFLTPGTLTVSDWTMTL